MSKMASNRSVIAKRFSWYEQKIGNWVILFYFILALSSVTLLKPYLDPLPISNLRLSMATQDLTKLVIEDTDSSQKLNLSNSQSSVSSGEVILKQERKPICNVSDPRFDICDIEGDVRIHGNSSSIFIASSSQMDALEGNKSWLIKPHPRKGDPNAMRFIREFSVKAIVGQEEAPPCSVYHSVPAVVFSHGGYSRNLFHSFSDVLIPVFETSAQFQGEVQFLVTNFEKHLIIKFQAILKQLSNYEIIDIDSDDQVHCYPRMIVGVKFYKDLKIDPFISNGYSMKMFRQLLINAYSLKKFTAIKISPDTQEKPRLLILSRKGSRSFMNVDEIAEMAKSLGFEVVVSEGMKNMEEFSHVVNSCDVMLGVHGAGLTNMVFLPTNAILIQVLPWGGFDWVASNCYGQPPLGMDLRYLIYKIKEEESSLLQKYTLDDPVIKDPTSIHKHNWNQFQSVYMDKQNVKIDVGRFRATLLEALELLHH
ncbi:alpha-1,3-arabinosyltransferase XAT3-like isoform X1 [Telopea speciosissima]|uniref:alpha-1,3-arabinosyltransferase XAT3-like isoform X1 n=1 Tax=Telopea speciosissima TaxID=54955 RepID=UPI001CC4510D|nr:alpha-1,3-arabinosyltransferase XAT3-like isoform X1 [Telopea speciosissima]